MSDFPSRSDLRSNPVHTGIAMEAYEGGPFIWNRCIPVRTVSSRSYEYSTWDFGANIRQDSSTDRAVGAAANEAVSPTMSHSTGLVTDHMLRDKFPDESRNEAPNARAVEAAKVRKLTWEIMAELEVEFRDWVTNTSNVTNATPSTKWDAGSPDIEGDIRAAKEAFRKQYGRRATHMILPPVVHDVFIQDSTIRGLRKLQDESLLLDGVVPPRVFGLGVLTPDALLNSANELAAASIDDIWNTDDVILLHVNMTASVDPTARTPLLIAQVGSFQAGSYRDPEPTRKTDWVWAGWEYDFVQPDSNGLYLLNNVLT